MQKVGSHEIKLFKKKNKLFWAISYLDKWGHAWENEKNEIIFFFCLDTIKIIINKDEEKILGLSWFS